METPTPRLLSPAQEEALRGMVQEGQALLNAWAQQVERAVPDLKKALGLPPQDRG